MDEENLNGQNSAYLKIIGYVQDIRYNRSMRNHIEAERDRR